MVPLGLIEIQDINPTESLDKDPTRSSFEYTTLNSDLDPGPH